MLLSLQLPRQGLCLLQVQVAKGSDVSKSVDAATSTGASKSMGRHRSGRYAALHILFSHAGKTRTRRGPTFGYGLALELLRIELSHKT